MLKWLLTIALVVVILGLLTPRLRRQGYERRLPGDVSVHWRGKDYHFPFTTTILLSLLVFGISRLI